MRTFKRSKPKGMHLSMAQVRYAYKKLLGTNIATDSEFHFQANAMFAEFGEAKILAALKDFSAADYVAGKCDC